MSNSTKTCFSEIIKNLYDDQKSWYSPTEKELIDAKWENPTIMKMDGFVRQYDPINNMFTMHSIWTKVTYYFKESGGNMTEKQIQLLKEKAKKLSGGWQYAYPTI